jgi:hypothetical protein
MWEAEGQVAFGVLDQQASVRVRESFYDMVIRRSWSWARTRVKLLSWT